MSTLRQMATIAVECIRTPGKKSIWSPELGAYLCEDDPRYQGALVRREAHADRVGEKRSGGSTVNPVFKLVFLTAAGGTVLFVGICVVVTILAGKEPMPDPLSKLVTGLFDLAKIGFGAVVGLLGGQTLKAE